MHDHTICVQHPEAPMAGYASLTTPTHRASTIVFDSAAAYAARKDRGPDGYTYGLSGTPTTKVLERQISDLHRGSHTVIVPSGQAAIAMIMLAVLKPGDRVLIPDTVYPPTRALCRNYLAARRIDHVVYDPVGPIEDLLDSRTRLVWIESPGSTTMEVQDVAAIVQACHARNILVGCDNTWATPLLFKPLLHGVDFAVEALTKYIGGHSDLLLGSITVRDKDHFALLRETMSTLGIGVSPDECSLALRGIETMAVRLRHVGAVAQRFAERLSDPQAGYTVLHPALPGAAGHEIWKRDFEGASGVFSVAFPVQAATRLDEALQGLALFAIGASWGGTRSLLAPMSVENDRHFGSYGKSLLLRVSIGLEDEAELWLELQRVVSLLDSSAE